jgi:5-methylcytosine-specific restriction endonuclease McrA
MKGRFSWKPKLQRIRHRTRAQFRYNKQQTHNPDSETIPRDARLFVWQRDGGRCRNCGSTTELHFDHIIPRSWGGSSLAENVELLCKQCNLKKGASLFAPSFCRSGDSNYD